MKASLLNYFVVVGVWLGIAGTGCNAPEPAPVERVKSAVVRDLDSLRYLVEAVLLPMAEHGTATDSLQRIFYRCRLAYKKIEFITEYFFPTASRFVNGPPLDEIETYEYEINEPGGLQVIEEYLFPVFDPTGRADLVREVKKLRAQLRQVSTLWQANQFTDAHVFDAARLQVFRIISLGISGFDTPLSRRALPEAAASLASLRHYLREYAPEVPSQPTYARAHQLLAEAIAYLNRNPAFDSFDRMRFITHYANPLTTQLLALQTELGIAPFTEGRPLRADAKTLFDRDAFNADFYAPDPSAYGSAEKVALGERLFYDPVLSSGNARSCATCHRPERAFTDGLPKSAAFVKGTFIRRNAPTLINAALQSRQFYDLRSTTLEHQAMDVVENKEEMHGSLIEAARELRGQSAYRTLFRKAYPGAGDSIRPKYIQNALASYVRSLVLLNARFDQYVRGDHARLTPEEIKGFNLFMGKAKCGTCHFLPLFNGTVPPGFTQSEAEVLGVPAQADGKQLDDDPGRYAIHATAQLKHAFKTPTLRNAAVTAPYMHNGVYRTLEEVIDFYNEGGGAGLGMDLPNQTLPTEPLNLRGEEKKAIVAFMRALTDTSAIRTTPKSMVSPAIVSLNGSE
ncbi:MAG: cytochrome C peroxidase [Ferruginibacter sp.]|nr:cytochrome C peroxidase [Cytophagales bacterium]